MFLLIPTAKTFRGILKCVSVSANMNVGKVEDLINPDAPRLVPTPEGAAAKGDAISGTANLASNQSHR
jgi:hypothetical protein